MTVTAGNGSRHCVLGWGRRIGTGFQANGFRPGFCEGIIENYLFWTVLCGRGAALED
jgi:hypothetical protein